MAAKGEKYAKVDINHAKWAGDYMRINNLNQTELANRLFYENGQSLNRARICEMLKGKSNTMLYLNIIVNSIYAGDYSAMAQYATDGEGRRVLAMLQFEKTLNEPELKAVLGLRELIEKAITLKRVDVLTDCKKEIAKKLQ